MFLRQREWHRVFKVASVSASLILLASWATKASVAQTNPYGFKEYNPMTMGFLALMPVCLLCIFFLA